MINCKLCKWLECRSNCFRCSKHELVQPCEDFELDYKITNELHKITIQTYRENKSKSELGGILK